MPTFLCSICQDLYRLQNLRCLPCGHTFCAPCITRCIEVAAQPDPNRRGPPRLRLPTCPSCRAKFKADAPHPIYVDTGDAELHTGDAAAPKPCHPAAVHKRIETAIQEVNRVENDLRFQTVQRAAQEMEKVVEISGDTQECLLNLVTAVAARWRGMLPVFSTIAKQRNDVMALEQRLRATEAERDSAVAEKSKAEDVATNAVATTELVHKALQDAKAELETSRIRIAALQEERTRDMDEQKRAMSGLHDSLRALKAKEVKQKAEIEELRKEARKNAELLRQAQAESQFVSLDDDFPDEDSQLLILPTNNTQRSYDMTGSQATYERLPSTSRKRKGSEDDLALLDVEPTYYQPPTPAPERRKVVHVVKSTKPQAPTFRTGKDWELPSQQVAKQSSSSRKLQRPASSATFPIELDRNGKPVKPVHTGSRKKFCRNS